MKHYRNKDLCKINTFHLHTRAREYMIIDDIKDLATLDLNRKYFILGGGSNILFVNDFDGLVIHNKINGIKVTKEVNNYIYLSINSGESWTKLVKFVTKNNWGGIENLAYIPGTVGGAPIQNIGAYGVEIAESVEYVKCFDLINRKFLVLTKDECNFGYRDSIFKKELKNKVFITEIGLKLTIKKHNYKLDYAGIKEEIERRKIQKISPEVIANIITYIRRKKLPNPNKIGNAGSFFKNPEIEKNLANKLLKEYPNMPTYPTNTESLVKIPAGWLIEQCGLKGYVHKGAAVHQNHALVLVNKNNATGRDILELANIIKKNVKNKFDIELEYEVNIII
ncbi:MAG: UDP-N-acetylmuramate dehydrogenase [Candidatus Dojkabacteria bacterium]|nr:UDP-N-acetylmuramate dehydrogenase [Candidatus Dojkabacteria bacterium]